MYYPMLFLALLIFALVALAAAAFAAVPIWRRARLAEAKAEPAGTEAPAPRQRVWVVPAAAAGAVFVLGLGAYALIGTPIMAVRDLERPAQGDEQAILALLQHDPVAVIDLLARQMRYRANDPTGWTLLGRNYLIFGNPPQAVRALERAVILYRAGAGRVPPDVLASYGIAQAQMAQAMTPEAEATFREVLAIDPMNQDARYYLGLAHVARGENEEALKIWEALAAEPGVAPWRQALPDQIAVLAARVGRAPAPNAVASGGPPDIQAMVDRLAARLATGEGDLNDWLMLIRAYGVMGQPDKARAVLARAEEIFAGDPTAQGELKKQAAASGLQ